MVTFLWAISTIILFSSSSMCYKVFQVNAGCKTFQTNFSNMVASGTVAAVFLMVKGFHMYFNTTTLVLAVLYGASLWFYFSAKIKASEYGPMAILTMSYVLGAVLMPTVYGILFLDEPPTWNKLVSIVLILLSFVPLLFKQDGKMMLTLKFLGYCAILFVINGAVCIIGKEAQLASSSEYALDFVGIYYFFYFVTSVVMLVVDLHKAEPEIMTRTITTKYWILTGVAGLLNACGSACNFKLMEYMPASVQFPLTQSSLLVVVTVASLIMYREKPKLNTIISLAITAAAIIMVSLDRL